MSEKELLKNCYELFTLEYGDKWKHFSNESLLKQTMIKLEEYLGENNEDSI